MSGSLLLQRMLWGWHINKWPRVPLWHRLVPHLPPQPHQQFTCVDSRPIPKRDGGTAIYFPAGPYSVCGCLHCRGQIQFIPATRKPWYLKIKRVGGEEVGEIRKWCCPEEDEEIKRKTKVFLWVGQKYQWNRNREQRNMFLLPWSREIWSGSCRKAEMSSSLLAWRVNSDDAFWGAVIFAYVSAWFSWQEVAWIHRRMCDVAVMRALWGLPRSSTQKVVWNLLNLLFQQLRRCALCAVSNNLKLVSEVWTQWLSEVPSAKVNPSPRPPPSPAPPSDASPMSRHVNNAVLIFKSSVKS